MLDSPDRGFLCRVPPYKITLVSTTTCSTNILRAILANSTSFPSSVTAREKIPTRAPNPFPAIDYRPPSPSEIKPHLLHPNPILVIEDAFMRSSLNYMNTPQGHPCQKLSPFRYVSLASTLTIIKSIPYPASRPPKSSGSTASPHSNPLKTRTPCLASTVPCLASVSLHAIQRFPPSGGMVAATSRFTQTRDHANFAP